MRSPVSRPAIPSLWPPGPYALAAAAARVVEAIVRRIATPLLVLCGVGAGRAAVCAMPVDLGPSGVTQVIEPSLTRQERDAGGERVRE